MKKNMKKGLLTVLVVLALLGVISTVTVFAFSDPTDCRIVSTISK